MNVVIKTIGEGQCTISVEDEGAGFDWRSLDLSLPLDPFHSRRRGYALIGALSERLEFNAKGNCIVAQVAAD